MNEYCVPAGENTELVGLYVSEKTGMPADEVGSYQAMAVFNANDEFIGGFLFANYHEFDLVLSAAAEHDMEWSDGVMRAVFRYIFWQLGCVRCTAFAKKGNKRARARLEWMGFQLEGNLRKGYDGKNDALIYGLLAPECRYLDDPEEPGLASEGGTGGASEGDEPTPEAVPLTH